MPKFIYVFSDENRDALLNGGYALLKGDIENHIYVFENIEELNFDFKDMELVFSDVLTF